MSTLKETSCDNKEVFLILIENEWFNSGERHDYLFYRLNNNGIFAYWLSTFREIVGVVVISILDLK
jgi:hypothetical protein